MAEISRARYRALYGPTTGDRVRLADTNLVIEVERDDCVGGGIPRSRCASPRTSRRIESN